MYRNTADNFKPAAAPTRNVDIISIVKIIFYH